MPRRPTTMRLTINCSVVLALCLTAASSLAQTDEARSRRRTFAVAMSKIKEGMTAADVERMLGRPDDVRAKNPRAWTPAGVAEIWGYGVDRHLDFPVLGQVQFARDRRVMYSTGGSGEPPPPEAITEETLASMLRIIDTAPPLRGDSYDPRSVIRIVNALHPLGKKNALLAVAEYLRVAPDEADARQGLYLVLRVLFDVPSPPGRMPELHEGVPGPFEPADWELVPRFPVLLIDDVPLLLVSGYTMSGESRGVIEHLRYFREFGTLRRKALVPPDQPFSLLERFDNLPRWYVERSSHHLQHLRSMVMSQLVRMTLFVHPQAKDLEREPYIVPVGHDMNRRWAALVEQISATPIRWDPVKVDYVRADRLNE